MEQGQIDESLALSLEMAAAHLAAHRWADAEFLYRHFLGQRPDVPEIHFGLGMALKEQQKLQEALHHFRGALALRPEMAEAWNAAGDTFRLLNQTQPAHQAFRRALMARPDYPEALNNLGILLFTTGQHAQGIEAFQKALALQPGLPNAWNNLGNAFRETRRPAEAIDAYRKTLELAGERPPTLGNLALVLKETAQLDQAIASVDRALALDPDFRTAHSNKLCLMHYHPGYDAEAIYQESQLWNERFARPLAAEIPVHDNDPSPKRRLRIGYVSPDFRNHVLALFLTPLLACHHHDDFEIFCYSNVSKPDAVTARLRRRADAWRDIAPLIDPQAAALIRQDKIDILVDLALHSAGGRLLVFARKPAPVQVTWLGYPGTTGLETIDYRLTDPRLDPVEAAEIQSPKSEIRNPKSESTPNDQNPNGQIANGLTGQQEAFSHLGIGKLGFDSDFGFRISDFSSKQPYYSERSLPHPDCFWIYDPRGMEEADNTPVPEPGPLPARSAGYVTFGCLNNFCKMNDEVFALFARVLASVPRSRLILQAQPGPHCEQAVQKLSPSEPDRVRFVAHLPRREYLQTYSQIDLALDTVPYNGHTTTLDALWMGVPVVTLVGRTVVGRAGSSHLHNLGLDDLVARDPDQFVKLGVELAGNLDRLSELRAALRPRMERSPLMDGPRFVGNLEKIYRQIWQVWCRGFRGGRRRTPTSPPAEST